MEIETRILSCYRQACWTEVKASTHTGLRKEQCVVSGESKVSQKNGTKLKTISFQEDVGSPLLFQANLLAGDLQLGDP